MHKKMDCFGALEYLLVVYYVVGLRLKNYCDKYVADSLMNYVLKNNYNLSEILAKY